MKNQIENLDKKGRQIFQDRIKRGMIGPGSDILVEYYFQINLTNLKPCQMQMMQI